MSLKFYLSRFAILLAYLFNRSGGHVLIISTLENIGINLFKLRAVIKLFSYLVYFYPVVANFFALKLILIIQVKWNTNRFFVTVWGWFDPPLNFPCSYRSWNTDPECASLQRVTMKKHPIQGLRKFFWFLCIDIILASKSKTTYLSQIMKEITFATYSTGFIFVIKLFFLAKSNLWMVKKR